jgi:hypothetical protein
MTATAVAVRERPILFSGPMVRAILEGRKTQTRRVMMPQPNVAPHVCTARDLASWRKRQSDPIVACWFVGEQPEGANLDWLMKRSPYGVVGDRLWVRETWSCPRQIGGSFVREKRMYKADELSPWLDYSSVVWKPSIHMPRQFSRITLEITAVRVERLQSISDDDAHTEGMEHLFESERWHRPDCKPWHEVRNDAGVCIEPAGCTCGNYSDAQSFRFLWDSINAKRGYGWDVNPWVWVLSFQRVL